MAETVIDAALRITDARRMSRVNLVEGSRQTG